MFDLETFRNLNDELKYELYKDLVENVTYFKRIIENLTVSTKEEERGNKFIDLENFKNTGNSKITENKFENEWSKIGTRSRNQNKRSENNQESKNNQEIKIQATNIQEEKFDQQRKHLFLPREGEYSGLLLGDSIVNRITGEQISENVLARGFGGHKISALLERVRNSKSRHFKHLTTLIGINDCLSSDFDAKEAVSSLEKLIYLINHKFSPETISLCTVTPLGAFRKDFNPNVQKLNKQILNLVRNVKDLGEVKLDILDINKNFSQNTDALSSDGLHPSDGGVEILVQSFRDSFRGSDINANTCEITTRPRMKQTQQSSNLDPKTAEMLQFFLNGAKFFRKY